MPEKSCTPPSPQQRQFMEIRETTEKAMLETIYKAIDDAAAEMADRVRSAGIDIRPTERDYFTFAAQQVLFVRLCGGDPNTFEGGDPVIGERIVSNGRYIIDHYWKDNGAQPAEASSQ
ncbi:hypothetical protein [Pararhizobium sp.]|uniref:hypothetical protein n=1 Tax=Pararhizobium sp. TaxID=1977563 RepID=UPI003BAB0B67